MAKARRTLCDYLPEEEPVAALWTDMVDIVYRDSPRQAHPERLSPAARTLWHVESFQGELINGGASQSRDGVRVKPIERVPAAPQEHPSVGTCAIRLRLPPLWNTTG
jgi:hypothetical protein